jgi:light-regulated signal transduction histidine kinase (bacteriophytochrome)
MQALIRDLLAFSRIGTHGSPLKPTDAAGVVADVLRDHRAAIGSGAAVTIGPLPTVMAERGSSPRSLRT